MFAVGNSSDTFILLKAKDVGMSTSAVILLYVLYNVVYAAGSLPLGGLSDRVGQYPLVIAGYVVFAAVYAGFAAAGSGWTLAVLFAVYGLYIAATEGTSKALIGRAIPTGERASALGLYYTATGLAAFAASTVGGLLWSAWGPWATFAYGVGGGASPPPSSCSPGAGACAARSPRTSRRAPPERGLGRALAPHRARAAHTAIAPVATGVERIRCPSRPADLEGDMARTCPACGRANDDDASFCQGCGAAVADAVQQAPPAPPLLRSAVRGRPPRLRPARPAARPFRPPATAAARHEPAARADTRPDGSSSSSSPWSSRSPRSRRS